jgi:hypothetical protein
MSTPTDVLRQEVLWRLQRVRKLNGGQFKASCPVPGHGKGNGDRDPSLSIEPGDKQPVVFRCHAGCDQDAVKAALIGLGINWALVSERRASQPAADDWWPCRYERGTRNPRPGHALVAEYRYHDERNQFRFAVVRCAAKCFWPWRPDPAGPHGRRWKLNGEDGIRLVPYLPYRLPQLLRAIELGRNVWVVEGEKDADRLATIGIAATCNDGGKGKGWRTEHAEWLAGADVMVVADRDSAGWKHATTVVETLLPLARSIEVIRAAEGKDASDHLNAGLRIGQFVQVAEPLPAPTAVPGCPDCAAEAT